MNNLKNFDKFSIVQDGSWDLLSALIELGKRKFAPPRTTIINAGDPPGGLFLVTDGCADVSFPSSSGEEALCRLCWPGDWFGHVSIFTHVERRATVRSRTSLSYIYVPAPTVLKFLEEDSGHWRTLASLVIRELQSEMTAHSDLLIGDSRLRCLATLVRLCGCNGQPPAVDYSRQLPVSQEELGQLTNLCRNGIGTLLRKFRQNGIISLQYRGIHVPSVRRLWFNYQEATI
ncbi:Crp/Fnr family transcriptional regulator [Croceibacterium salegens]|nr:Crp/Fnr family transcriptional regulator [Croceibacterium salegens]